MVCHSNRWRQSDVKVFILMRLHSFPYWRNEGLPISEQALPDEHSARPTVTVNRSSDCWGRRA